MPEKDSTGNNNTGKIAVLIDAENIDPAFSQEIFSYARSQGEVTIQQIYGSGTALNDWADSILENTIQPCFTLRPSKYKNSTDISLTIGAMEILARNGKKDEEEKNDHIDVIIIASSDSDFSPLAFHLRSAGMDVIGMGEPGRFNPTWPKACTEFVTLDATTPLIRNREEASLPDHSVRVEIIRDFIDAQLDANDGRIKSSDLFRALAMVPEYVCDQRGSKKRPLEYLMKMYSEWFIIEHGEKGVYWISKKEETGSSTDSSVDSSNGSSADSSVGSTLPAVKPVVTPTIPQEEAPAMLPSGSPEEKKEESADNNIPPEDSEKIRTIVAESKNMRVVYNTLSKTFGRSLGLKYYAIVKNEIAARTEMPARTEITARAQQA